MDEILQAPVEVGRSSGYPPRPTNSLTVESEVFFFFRGPALHKNEQIINKLNLAQVRLLEADFKESESTDQLLISVPSFTLPFLQKENV